MAKKKKKLLRKVTAVSTAKVQASRPEVDVNFKPTSQEVLVGFELVMGSVFIQFVTENEKKASAWRTAKTPSSVIRQVKKMAVVS